MNTGDRTQNKTKSFFGVKAKLLLSFTFMTLTTICACAIGYYSFSTIEDSINRITVDSVPDMTSAMTLAQKSGYFESTIPLLAGARTIPEKDTISTKLRSQIDDIQTLAEQITDDTELYSVIAELRGIQQSLNNTTSTRISSRDSLNDSVGYMISTQRDINKQLLVGLDDAGFNLEIAAEDVMTISGEALDSLANQSLVNFRATLALISKLDRLMLELGMVPYTTLAINLEASRQTARLLAGDINGASATIDLDESTAAAIAELTALVDNPDGLYAVRGAEIDQNSIPSDSMLQARNAGEQLQQVRDELDAKVDTIYSELMSQIETASELNTTGIPQLLDPGFSGVSLLLQYRADTNVLVGLLSQAVQLDSIENLAPLVDRVEAIKESLAVSLDDLGAVEGGQAMQASVSQLLAFANPDTGVVAQKLVELEANDQFRSGLATAKSALDQLLDIINHQVDISKQAVDSASAASLAAISLSKKLMEVFALTSFIVAVLLIWLLVSRNILKRLITVIKALRKISEGQLDHKVEVTGRDELGELGRVVDVFREKALENKRLQEQESRAVSERAQRAEEKQRMEAEKRLAQEERQRIEQEQSDRELQQAQALRNDTDSLLQVVRAASTGDLTHSISVNGDHPTGQLAAGLATLIESFTQVMNQIASTTQIVSQATQEIVNGNGLLSERTEQQTKSLDDTSVSMQTITQAVNQNSASAKSANTLAHDAQTHTQEVGNIVTEAVNAMKEINDSSAEMSAIVSAIDDIAFQTNLLALNAAVEAARAGEQGRGFAVVASEVRNLAARSGVAAGEIKNLIEDSVKKVNHGVKLVARSESTLDELLTSVRKVTEIVKEISVQAENQRVVIDTVNNAVAVLEQTTGQNAVMVEQVTAHSAEMAAQTSNLREQVSFFTFRQDSDHQRAIKKVA